MISQKKKPRFTYNIFFFQSNDALYQAKKRQIPLKSVSKKKGSIFFGDFGNFVLDIVGNFSKKKRICYLIKNKSKIGC